MTIITRNPVPSRSSSDECDTTTTIETHNSHLDLYCVTSNSREIVPWPYEIGPIFGDSVTWTTIRSLEPLWKEILHKHKIRTVEHSITARRPRGSLTAPKDLFIIYTNSEDFSEWGKVVDEIQELIDRGLKRGGEEMEEERSKGREVVVEICNWDLMYKDICWPVRFGTPSYEIGKKIQESTFQIIKSNLPDSWTTINLFNNAPREEAWKQRLAVVVTVPFREREGIGEG